MDGLSFPFCFLLCSHNTPTRPLWSCGHSSHVQKSSARTCPLTHSLTVRQDIWNWDGNNNLGWRREVIAVLMATPSVTFTFGPLIVPKRVFLTPIPHSSAISKPLLLVKNLSRSHIYSLKRESSTLHPVFIPVCLWSFMMPFILHSLQWWFIGWSLDHILILHYIFSYLIKIVVYQDHLPCGLGPKYLMMRS